jgi:putative hemolysin
LSAFITASVVYSLFPDRAWWFLTVISTLSITSLLLIFGEVVPKSLAIKFPVRYSLFVIEPLYRLQQVTAPMRFLFSYLAQKIATWVPIKPQATANSIMEDEFKTLVDFSRREGVLNEYERKLIHKVFEYGDKTVSDVMVPRTEMNAIPLDISFEGLKKWFHENHWSRAPVYKENEDNIVGILVLRDLLGRSKAHVDKSGLRLESVLRTPYFVPESKKLDALFKEFKRKKIHMAIVVDEYGGVAGLVTMEDILEELFGEIKDEYDVDGWTYDKIDDHHYRVSGQMELSEFNSILGVKLASEDTRTIGGYVFNLFGRLPQNGHHIERDGLKFTVKKMEGTKISAIDVAMFEDGHCPSSDENEELPL